MEQTIEFDLQKEFKHIYDFRIDYGDINYGYLELEINKDDILKNEQGIIGIRNEKYLDKYVKNVIYKYFLFDIIEPNIKSYQTFTCGKVTKTKYMEAIGHSVTWAIDEGYIKRGYNFPKYISIPSHYREEIFKYAYKQPHMAKINKKIDDITYIGKIMNVNFGFYNLNGFEDNKIFIIGDSPYTNWIAVEKVEDKFRKLMNIKIEKREDKYFLRLPLKFDYDLPQCQLINSKIVFV